MTDYRYTLYGDSRSGNCYKAALILRLTGRSFDWVETDVLARATRTAAFLKLNPNGKVPLLQLPDGRCLAESNAMLLYLAEGSDYLPTDSYRRALVYQWLFFEQYSHEPSIAVARFIVHLAGRANEEADRLGQLRQQGRRALRIMDGALETCNWFGGEEFSVADIALYAYTHVAPEGGVLLDDYRNIVNWLARVQAQPGFLPMAEACAST